MGDLINCSWGYPVPFKHVVKVSDRVYEKLQELVKATGAKSPNQALETLLSELDHRVTPSARIERRRTRSGSTWLLGRGMTRST